LVCHVKEVFENHALRRCEPKAEEVNRETRIRGHEVCAVDMR